MTLMQGSCSSISLLIAAFSATAALTFGVPAASATASDTAGDQNEVVLPPPPVYGTPASAMRLPNLPPLGDGDHPESASSASSTPANTEPAPGAAALLSATRSALAKTSPAENLLQALRQRTGLSDAQEAELLAAQKRRLSGDEAGALRAAQLLSAKLDRDTRVFIVGDGNNLFSIAGMVYANTNLWPLLWWSNQPLLVQPWRLTKSMQLTVLAHPSIEQVSLALNYAHTHSVLTARPEDRDLLNRAAIH